MKTNLFSYVLGILVMGALGLAVVRYNQTPARTFQDDKLKTLQQKKDRFPVAEYDEPDSNDPQKDKLRKDSILTAYSLNSDGVSPLDDSPQFEPLRGLTEQALIEKLQNASATS